MKILETEHLLLRTFKESDVAPMLAINQDPKVMEYFPALQNEEETRALIDRINAHQEQHGYSLYAVELKATGEMIGFVGLMYRDFEAHFTPVVEIGWRLASTHWNQGYATEAARAVLDYAFSVLGLKEIVSFTSEINMPSRRVMEKLGFTHNPKDDFDHPKLEPSHRLSKHVLYRVSANAL